MTLASAVVYQPMSNLIQNFNYGNGLNDWNTYTLDYELDVGACYNGATKVIERAHTRTDALNLTNIWDNVTTANNQSYWANPANRLQNASGPWGAKTFYYDGVGNRTQEISTPVGGSAVTDTLNYAATSNRISTVTRPGLGNRTFTYDNAGNILTDNGTGGNKTYVYNKRNRLSQATVGALIYNYTYNAQEQLAIRTSPSTPTTTHFIHDRMGNVIAETAGGGATGATGTMREYIYLYEAEIAPTMGSRTVVDRPLAVVSAVNTASPATYWVSVDHLNRPIKMTDATKASKWDAIWQPWGGVHGITGTASYNARFPGQWFQIETGLHYNWHRSYDPTLGRYTQPDPLGFVDGPSVYAYAGGSPQRFVDPDGRVKTPASRLSLRECNVPEQNQCAQQCIGRGVKDCKRSQYWTVIRVRGLTMWGWKDAPNLNCTCRDPDPEPNYCPANCRKIWQWTKDVMTGIMIFTLVTVCELAL